MFYIPLIWYHHLENWKWSLCGLIGDLIIGKFVSSEYSTTIVEK